jgi:transcriptional regulator with XRE-family HTH domain
MRFAELATVDPAAKAVGDRVKAEMERQSIRQSAVAKRLRMSQPAVSRRIIGVVPFDVSELEKIARLLDVPVTSFLTADAA